PDWLGEIFLWLSSSLEASITDRDDVGRIPYHATVFGQQGLSPQKPYASMLMAWMENALRKAGSEDRLLPKAPSPLPNVDHVVVHSHDIDFYYVNWRSAVARTIKNLAIAVRSYRSGSYFADNLRMLTKVLFGSRVGTYVLPLAQAVVDSGFRSTFFVVARRGHRRDPDYGLQEMAPILKAISERGFSIGIHGSYHSVIEDRSLAAETKALAAAAVKPLGGRRHWLRLSSQSELFDAVADAGLIADSTLGFSDMPGFRNGAAFAFPPYDLVRERPCTFLEVPLVLMDGALQAAALRLK